MISGQARDALAVDRIWTGPRACRGDTKTTHHRHLQHTQLPPSFLPYL